MRNLPSRLLARLRVSRKLMLIYLLDLSAVIYVSSILINEKYIAIDFARKELSGNAYIAEVRDVFVGAARLGSGAPEPGPAGSGWQPSVVQAEQRHGAGMRSAEVNAALAGTLARAAASGSAHRGERQRAPRRGRRRGARARPRAADPRR